MKYFFAVLLSIFSINALAQPVKNGFTAEELVEMAGANSATAQFESEWKSLFSGESPLTFGLLSETTPIALAEYENAGYLLFNSDFHFDSYDAKRKMAETLPEGVTLVVYTYSNEKNHIDRVKRDFLDVIDASRLKVIYLPNAHRGFWARDGVPVPVWRQDSNGVKKFAVVDARYYHGFEADQVVADHFGAGVTAHNYFYEGGNFLTNSRGECIIADNTSAQEIPDSVFEDHYGCTSLMRLPHNKGIGHIDESVKFIDDTTIVTDDSSYVDELERAGYTVKMLPRPQYGYETYVNSLIVNGTVYVPVFNHPNDALALKVYEDMGLKVVPLTSIMLSNQGAGSIHCITMTYPPVDFAELVEAIDAQPVN